MSILPKSDDLHWKYNIAALDIDIPDSLITEKDKEEWGIYAQNISPAKLVLKFNEAAEQFLKVTPKQGDLTQLPQAEKELILSKWEALTILGNCANERFRYCLMPDVQDSFNSCLEEHMTLCVEFLSAVNSPLAEPLEQKKKEYCKLGKRLSSFLNHII